MRGQNDDDDRSADINSSQHSFFWLPSPLGEGSGMRAKTLYNLKCPPMNPQGEAILDMITLNCKLRLVKGTRLEVYYTIPRFNFFVHS